ncbi:MAG: phenylacetic acid degradation operon negative regulatory protein [Parcubacteria group bacterium Gr01-1014_73]|nr:MAG: phenylacetic acid degradation operon negative regulatory protein [Parcubacteria group bacterium Gr01-1014_73]
MRNKRVNIKEKILILLLGGLALGLTRSPKQYFEILGEMADEWRGIRKYNIRRSIKNLYRVGMLKEVKNKDGTVSIILSDKGKRSAKIYSIDNLKINKPKIWDGNWRVVIFDVPERIKKVREALRMHLHNLGFYELQKSVFICPFPCAEEINQIIDFYDISKHVRILMVHSLDNEDELRNEFGI